MECPPPSEEQLATYYSQCVVSLGDKPDGLTLSKVPMIQLLQILIFLLLSLLLLNIEQYASHWVFKDEIRKSLRS